MKKIRSMFFILLFVLSECTAYAAAAASAPKSPRRYFEGCDNTSFFVDVKEGMTRQEILNATKGKEFKGYETVQGGFTIALDGKHTRFYIFRGWIPRSDREVDYFISGKNILIVMYKSGTAAVIHTTPIDEKNVVIAKTPPAAAKAGSASAGATKQSPKKK